MSISTQEYLEALFSLTPNNKSASTSDISKRLNISPASVTEMLKKLSDSGYVNYSPYKGVTLTPKGYEIAEKMARKHRLLERFLHDMLHIGNDKVHNEACAMEHALSDETERALCQTLNAPNRCPDDEKIIPPCNLGFSDCEECQKWNGNDLAEIGKRKSDIVSICSLKEKQSGKIAFIRGDKRSIHRLLDLGLTSGTRVTVKRIAPLKGPVEIDVRGCRLALGEEIACNVFVEKTSTETRASGGSSEYSG
jgi:DtxR family Mn-dependent transcriptional regulator